MKEYLKMAGIHEEIDRGDHEGVSENGGNTWRERDGGDHEGVSQNGGNP